MSVTIQSLGPATVPVKGADVASASIVTLTSGSFQHITGTTTITDIDFDTATNGAWAWVTFDGALTLTYNATTLKLPGSANISLRPATPRSSFGTRAITSSVSSITACRPGGVRQRVRRWRSCNRGPHGRSYPTHHGHHDHHDVDFDSANDGNFAWVVSTAP